jgi:Viral BACON domain/Putative binding domain, N-terminal
MSGKSKWSLALLLALAVAVIACGSGSPSEPAPTPCSYTVSPSTLSFEASGGSGSVTVTTGANCAWTATSDKGWASITAGANATGSGVVSVAVSSHTAAEARTGTLTIAGQSVSVTQQPPPPIVCTYEIAPASAAYSKDGGAGSFTVTAPEGCHWTASTTDSWITVAPPATDPTGNGTVTYTVARNTQLGGRTGGISVASRRFEVTQAGDTGLCQYQVSPVELSPCMAASQITTSIATDAACPWTVTSDVAWMSIAGGGSGSGPATIQVNVGENWDAPRNGLLMVRWPTPTAGQNVRVSQAGCRYAVSTSAISVVATGGTARFDVYQQSDPYTCGGPLQNGCMWIAQSDVPWITVTTSMPQFGDNPVSLTIAANDAATARSGNVRVRDQVVRITQAGR